MGRVLDPYHQLEVGRTHLFTKQKLQSRILMDLAGLGAISVWTSEARRERSSRRWGSYWIT